MSKNNYNIKDSEHLIEILNALSKAGDKDEFFEYMMRFRSVFREDFRNPITQEIVTIDNVFFEPKLTSTSLQLLLESEVSEKNFKLALSFKGEDFAISAFRKGYIAIVYSEDNDLMDEDERNTLKAELYESFIHKLKILHNYGFDLNKENNIGYKISEIPMSVNQDFEYADKFIISKFPHFFKTLQELNVEVSEYDFNSFLQNQSIPYTEDVPYGIKELCEMFPDYKINLITLKNLFKVENNQGEIYVTEEEEMTDEYMIKRDLSISAYMTQDNTTLLRYFIERDSINFNEKPFSDIDLLSQSNFQETARILIEHGAKAHYPFDCYPGFVEMEYMNQIEKEKELLKKSINKINDIEESPKRRI